jgi:iron complex transport system substrate-binding protein
MIPKRFVIISTALIILVASVMAGCISSNDNDDSEPNIVTETFNLNQTKSITVDENTHEITIINIEKSNVTISIKSEPVLIKLTLNVEKEVDSDRDGENDLKLTLTEISGTEVKVKFTTSKSTSEYNYFKDDSGTTVKVPKKIETIISLSSSITEILYELELGSKIVGIDSGSNYPPEVKKIDVVMTFEGVDIEKILAKDPDLIIMDKTLDLSEKNYDKMTSFGMNVFRVYPKNLDDILDNIVLLGEITATSNKASEIVISLQERIDTVKTRGAAISDSTSPKVLHVVYYDGASSPWVHTSSTFSGDLISIAGGDVVMKDSSGFSIQITVEELISKDPDIIFTSQDDTWPTPSRDSILNDDLLDSVSAVKNDYVLDLNADLVDRPGPRMIDGLELISNHISNYISF